MGGKEDATPQVRVPGQTPAQLWPLLEARLFICLESLGTVGLKQSD